MTVKIFEEKILKGDLAMVAPDVEIDGRGVVIISSGGSTRTDMPSNRAQGAVRVSSCCLSLSN